LKLSQVEKSLNLSETETEFWIIKALQSGHIDGKIDQLEGIVYINAIHDSSFKNDDWNLIEKKLEGFCKKFDNMITDISKDRQQASH